MVQGDIVHSTVKESLLFFLAESNFHDIYTAGKAK